MRVDRKKTERNKKNRKNKPKENWTNEPKRCSWPRSLSNLLN